MGHVNYNYFVALHGDLNPYKRSYHEMVLNIDVAPTILELAGIEVPENTDGRSLVSLMKGKEKSWRKDKSCGGQRGCYLGAG
ncbi:MAG: sulfatase/phosphatase domain-containing protein [Planctomycetota bacterium]|jgi:arylsulfatase A-like enzyme